MIEFKLLGEKTYLSNKSCQMSRQMDKLSEQKTRRTNNLASILIKKTLKGKSDTSPCKSLPKDPITSSTFCT